MDQDTLLQHYFAGTLSKKDRERFEALLASNSDFRVRFDFESNLQKAIRDVEKTKLKSKLIRFEEDLEDREVVNQGKKTGDAPFGSNEDKVSNLRVRKIRNWSIAASVALLIGLGLLGFYLSTPNYESLYEKNFEPYPNTVFTITRGEGSESLEREAFVAYESGDYTGAVGLLKG